MELWGKAEIDLCMLEEPPARQSAYLLRMEISTALVLFDIFAIATGFGVVILLFGWPMAQRETLTVLAFFGSTYLIFAIYGHAFNHEVIEHASKSMNRMILSYMGATTTLFLVALLIDPMMNWGKINLVTAAAGSLIMLVIFRWVFESLISRKVKKILFDKIIIIDNVDIPIPHVFRAIDAYDQAIEPDAANPMMRHWASLFLQDADKVVIACQPEKYRPWVQFLKGSNVHVELLMPELNDLGIMSVSRHFSDTTIAISKGTLSHKNRILKRFFDIVLAAILIVLTAPVVLLCSLLIKLDDRGPIFFKQQRVGRGNRLFEVYKFRSMAVRRVDGVQKVTAIGRYIRAMSIDELPQLYNVLKGQMSLVGPRPHALNSQVGNQLFWEVEKEYWQRHAIKPGITGLAQVRGYRGATALQSDLTRRLQCDLEYLRGWSIWRDLAILVATLRVLAHKNAR